MRTDIQWAELHAPLFLAGTNLGQKLDPAKRMGLKMEYDEERRHLYVTYNNRSCRIPETSVLSMVENEKVIPISVREPVAVNAGSIPTKPFEAQVSTPTSHVFAGAGAGQTGQEPPVKRAPGRPKTT